LLALEALTDVFGLLRADNYRMLDIRLDRNRQLGGFAWSSTTRVARQTISSFR
jgi:hypothetical protein